MPAAQNRFEIEARKRKVRALIERIDDQCSWMGIDSRREGFAIADMLASWGDREWEALADNALVNLPHPESRVVNHGGLCPCTACVLARAYDGATPEADASAQVEMTAIWLRFERRTSGIESILADTGLTNHDRDARGL
jgi:hypothetical protein